MSQSGATLVQLLKTREAAELLGLSSRALEKHRTYGTGPVYRKLGGRVVYDVVDLRTWGDKGRRASTSDFGTDTVYPAKAMTEKR
ncbi:helix-turn-helix domain-containing protein [Brucella sp. NBRC 12950]|uniref:helix-turn-helix transcriptional regulator n=1 Tax=Brucella sp. NBRC 12950 TaxID=2994518 RepID=UPI0024A1C331|nr:helix-turn-helix domain-containing protein [Brucella sp. NBRC 12950]GLU30136.1 transcriptional regulator [Brucella sp. NBRC 12950]